MIVTCAIATLVVFGVVIELLVPGAPLYHFGWYNVLLASLVVMLAFRMRVLYRSLGSTRTRAGATLAAFGVAIVAFAGIASGLLGPDARTIVGAPGESIHVDELGGSLAFPLAQNLVGDASITLVRGGRNESIGARRYVGSSFLRSVARSVVGVEASDAHDAHLTITQPTGAAFLSPVLLMQTRETIAGIDLPYDSFAVPAAHRIVKAVLFPPHEASQLHGLHAPPGVSAVLFDVEDDAERQLPNNIGVALDGGSVRVSGLAFHPRVFSYPALEIIAIPDLPVTIIGLFVMAAGIVMTTLARNKSRTA